MRHAGGHVRHADGHADTRDSLWYIPAVGKNAKITWIGHASALVDIGGERVLIDPLGRRRCADIDQYSAVLVTHSHVDHLNRWTLSTLDKSVPLHVPKGARRIVQDLGFREVVEMEPGDHRNVGGLDIVSVPTRHDNGRWRKGDSPICNGYVIGKDGAFVHHAGDVDMSDYDVFDDIGRDFQLDATLLPIGGMLPVWYYRMRRRSRDRGVHIDPDTALAISERLGATRMVPIHWGTVNLRLGPVSGPRRRLLGVAAERGLENLVHVLGHGDVLTID